MRLIVGLGNIGKEYENTYHNIGFHFLDYVCGKENWQENKKLLSLIYKENDIIFVKPTTFMNLSGNAVRLCMNYWKIDLENVLIIQDDTDILLGEFKFQKNRGSGGHKGIISVSENVKTNDFSRIRIGARSPDYEGLKSINFVLKKISTKDQEILEKVYKEVINIIK